jgi:hypothetical protein
LLKFISIVAYGYNILCEDLCSGLRQNWGKECRQNSGKITNRRGQKDLSLRDCVFYDPALRSVAYLGIGSIIYLGRITIIYR